jgi:hypothetical protein
MRGKQYYGSYDIQRNCYWISDLIFGYDYAVAGVIEDRLYVVCNDVYKVIDKDLEIVQRGKLNYCYSHDIYAMKNIVVRDDTIYFYNSVTDWIEFVNFKQLQGGIEFFTELYDQKQEENQSSKIKIDLILKQ